MVLAAYAHADKNNRMENKGSIQLEWTMGGNFPKLAKPIDDAILYAQFAQAPIPE